MGLIGIFGKNFVLVHAEYAKINFMVSLGKHLIFWGTFELIFSV